MYKFTEQKPEELVNNPFVMIGKDWMLVTAEKDGKSNTMTASWGGLGVMWGKNVAFVVLRPQRYTKEFIDTQERFSLSFLGEEHRKTMSYLGSVSGKDESKIEKSGLTLSHSESAPYFAEADTVIFCRKLFSQAFLAENFIDQSLLEKWYPGEDYHTLYIAEIEKVLVKSC